VDSSRNGWVDGTRGISNINSNVEQSHRGGCLRHKEAGIWRVRIIGPFPAKCIDERRRRRAFHQSLALEIYR
jgi:hypothetical protein